MDRSKLVQAISQRLGKRNLVWFGTRGDDVESAVEIPQLRAAFSIIAAYRRRSYVHSLALEEIGTGRIDLDGFDIDDAPRSDAVTTLRRAMLGELARPSAVFTYRPSTFLSAVCFARRDRCSYLGLFNGLQMAFEHKPWVETEIAALGVDHIPWTYVADDEQLESLRILRDGPVMLRRSRTTGGAGLFRADTGADLKLMWPEEDEAYVSVAPYIAGGLPLNVGAVVWHDGITLHPASIQLIGVPSLSTRPFGYCGNDFGAVCDLDASQLQAVEDAVLAIGSWLRRFGYLGAFGVDFLVKDGVALFMEINPRLQGSTHASCQISVESEESCILIEHLASLLGMDAPASLHLADLASNHGLAHLVVHWTGPTPEYLDPTDLVSALAAVPATSRSDVVTSPRWLTHRGGTIARVTVRDRLTATGFDLVEPWNSMVTHWVEAQAHGGRNDPGSPTATTTASSESVT